MGRKKAAITTKEFDALIDAGEELVGHLDLSTARRPGLRTQRVNVDFPEWEVDPSIAKRTASASRANRSSRSGSPSAWSVRPRPDVDGYLI